VLLISLKHGAMPAPAAAKLVPVVSRRPKDDHLGCATTKRKCAARLMRSAACAQLLTLVPLTSRSESESASSPSAGESGAIATTRILPVKISASNVILTPWLVSFFTSTILLAPAPGSSVRLGKGGIVFFPGATFGCVPHLERTLHPRTTLLPLMVAPSGVSQLEGGSTFCPGATRGYILHPRPRRP